MDGYRRCRQQFQFWDMDGDGRVSREEIVAGLNALGYSHVSETLMGVLFERFDLNGDGVVTMAEFFRGLSSGADPAATDRAAAELAATTAEGLQDAVRQLDLAEQISEEDCAGMVAMLGPDPTPQTLRAFLRGLDQQS